MNTEETGVVEGGRQIKVLPGGFGFIRVYHTSFRKYFFPPAEGRPFSHPSGGLKLAAQIGAKVWDKSREQRVLLWLEKKPGGFCPNIPVVKNSFKII